MLQSLFYLTIAVHVSSIVTTHLQEHKTTVTTASGNRYIAIHVKMSYIGQTSRNPNQRYREHIRYIRNNDPIGGHCS